MTTDMGLELNLPSVPNILTAFVRRMNGFTMASAAQFIDFSSNLVPLCMRVGGWGHMFGNLMKYYLSQFECWPTFLSQMRVCCKFWRNETHRDFITNKLASDVPGIRQTLKSFTASFAKWRYETAYTVFTALSKLRQLIQGHLSNIDVVMGRTFQDTALLSDARAAFRNDDLWIFIDVQFKKALNLLEHARRWGLVCWCCSDARHAGGPQQSKCTNSSRRLHQARLFLKSVCDTLLERGRTFQLPDFEGSLWICSETTLGLRKASIQLQMKGGNYSKCPYLISEADDPVIAQMCVEQLTSIPNARLDPLMRHLLETCLEPLKVLQSTKISFGFRYVFGNKFSRFATEDLYGVGP